MVSVRSRIVVITISFIMYYLKQDLRLPLLPPLKKVLTNQSLIRNRYNERNLLDSTPVTVPVSDASRISMDSSPSVSD